MVNKKKLKQQLMRDEITISRKEWNQMQNDAINKATKQTDLIPLLVLRDKFGFGKKRLGRYLQYYAEAVSSYNQGYFKLTDIEKMLMDEVKIGIKWDEEVQK